MKIRLTNQKIFIFLVFYISVVFSQRETDNWVFGEKSGLNFQSLIPTSLNNLNIQSHFGCSSISDVNGNLLFYTNGLLVWTKNNTTMENGFLVGDIYYDQSTIIIPKPGSEKIYYIFTNKPGSTDPFGNLISSGLYYSVVDMSYNGGLGKVIRKNFFLIGNTTEKITAVHHKNGKSIWLITSAKENNNTEFYNLFFSIEINENGISPVFINSNTIHDIRDKKGYLKASPDGKKIASADYNSGLQIYDFNNETGKLSNPQWLFYVIRPMVAPSQYGIAFSQDSKFLYSNGNFGSTNYLQQFDLQDMPYGRVIISESERLMGALQLAKNGKIYCTYPLSDNEGKTQLSVIKSPNKLGLDCSYIVDHLTLNYGSTFYGLPNFIQSYFRTRILTKQACLNNPTLFEVDTYANITAASWDFGDNTSSTDISPLKVFSSTGEFLVKVTITINNRQITVSKKIIVYPVPTLNNNTKLLQCDADNNGINYFDLFDIRNKITNTGFNETLIFYESRNDAENDINRISSPSQYQNTSNFQELFVRVINKNNCFSITNFFLESISVQFGNISEMFVCENSDGANEDFKGLFDLNQKRIEIRNEYHIPNSTTLKFYPTLIDAQTTNNEINDTFISLSTYIWVRAETILGCGGIEKIKLTVNNPIVLSLSDEYTLCIKPNLHSPMILDGDPSNSIFEWKNQNGLLISTNRFFTLTHTGLFTLTVYKSENGLVCSRTKIFLVKHPPPPVFNSIEINTETPNNNVKVSVLGSSSYAFSLDGIYFEGDGLYHNFQNVDPGIKTLYVKDKNNCEPPINKEISIIGFPKFLTPNEDGKNDRWRVYGATPEYFKFIEINIFNRFGRQLYSIHFNNYQFGWDGRLNGKKLPPDDYWFNATLIDYNDKIIKKMGSFSLIK